ncbi:glycosyltransferase family 4 protein [Kamptonema cortianum]|nr:glycosyltransferase family 4 protein [Geitlerinema splendidum]MDK3155883.1 glycosyltransferase family 4 protein [Kamptonema cortianum]
MRILLVGRYDGGLIPGGAEVQLHATKALIESAGHEAEIVGATTNQWGDLVHFFGPYDYYWSMASLCIERKIPYVVSSIWYQTDSISALSFRGRIKKATHPGHRKVHKLFNRAEQIIVPMNVVTQRLKPFFQVNHNRFSAIPSSPVSAEFASADPQLFRQAIGFQDDFVLCVANLHERKNQLNLIQAIGQVGKHLVIIGNDVDPAYANECRSMATKQVTFFGGLNHSDPMLPSAYAAARVVAMPSVFEDYLIAGIEAGVAGKPLVLSSNWHPQELYQHYAETPDAHSPSQIAQAIERAWNKTPDPSQSEWFLTRYGPQAIQDQLIQLYQSVLQK